MKIFIQKILIKIFNRFWNTDESFQLRMVDYFSDKSFYLQGQMDINPIGKWFNKEITNQTGGFFLKDDITRRQITPIDPWDNTRRDMIILLLRTILVNGIPGDLAEIGVYKGYTAKLIHYYLPEKYFYVFDTFEGFSNEDIVSEMKITGYSAKKEWFRDTSLEAVINYISPLNENIKTYKGVFPQSCPQEVFNKKFAFVHLDVDLYNPTMSGLTYFYPLMAKGGILLIHDYMAWIGARNAVDDFFLDKIEKPIIMPDKNGSAVIVKF